MITKYHVRMTVKFCFVNRKTANKVVMLVDIEFHIALAFLLLY